MYDVNENESARAPEAFIAFEAKTVFIDPRLKFKILVNNLISGTLLADQITDIYALHPILTPLRQITIDQSCMAVYIERYKD